MSNLTIGSLTTVPDLPGRWSVWSNADEGPGSVFLVPADDEARTSGFKYAVVRALNKSTNVKVSVELIRTDPPMPERPRTYDYARKARR